MAHGMGDLQVGGRLRLFGKAGGLPPVSVVTQMNLPTADPASGLGTGRVDSDSGPTVAEPEVLVRVSDNR